MKVYIGKYAGTKDEFFILCLPSTYNLKDYGFMMIDSVGEPVYKNGKLLLYKVKDPFIVDFRATLEEEEDDFEWINIDHSKTGFIHEMEDDILPIEKFKEMIDRCDEIEEQHGPCIICGKKHTPYKNPKGSGHCSNMDDSSKKSGWICSEKCMKKYIKNPPKNDEREAFGSVANIMGYSQIESGMAAVPINCIPKEKDDDSKATDSSNKKREE